MAMHARRYTAFISYRHADNTQEGRRWAEWLHRALERYVVPPDLIGTPNLRGEPIRDSLYPIFRDEDELPANADLATGIRAALEVSDHLIVLCSPRSAVSPWVRKEVREFKELGRSDRILAIIIAGEPNADDPAKAREGILRDEECFCEELRFGAVRDDGTLDWTIRTEPLAADLRPVGTRAEGFVTAEAYREYLTLNSSLTPDKIAARTEAYRQQLDHAMIKVIAGLLGIPLGQLIDRDAAHRTALAEAEAAKQRQIAERERQLADQAQQAKLATEQTARRLALAGAGALILALCTGWFWSQARKEKNEADRQRSATQTALIKSNRNLERSQIEEGRAWIERANAAKAKGDQLSAFMLAGRAVGYEGYGRKAVEEPVFENQFPLLLGKRMNDTQVEADRLVEVENVRALIGSMSPTYLPLWSSPITAHHESGIDCVAYSPDGSRIVSAGISGGRSFDSIIKLWDGKTHKIISTLKGPKYGVSGVSFTATGSILAIAGRDGSVIVWDVASAKVVQTLHGQEGEDGGGVNCVAISPDGSHILGGTLQGNLDVWQRDSRREVSFSKQASIRVHEDSINGVCFTPDGSVFATGSDDKITKLWSTNTLKQIGENLNGHEEAVTGVTFSRDGSVLATASDDNSVKLWDPKSHRVTATLKGPETEVKGLGGLAFNPDGSRIVGIPHFIGALILWDVATKTILAQRQSFSHSASFSADGAVLACSSGDSIQLLDGKTLADIHPGVNATGTIASARFSPDGSQILTVTDLGEVCLWDVSTGKKLKDYGNIGDVTFSQDSSLLIGHGGAWSTESGALVSKFDQDDAMTRQGVLSSNAAIFAGIVSKNTIKVWDTSTGRQLIEIRDGEDPIDKLALCANGNRIVSVGVNDSINIWSLSGEKVKLDRPRQSDRRISFPDISPEGGLVLIGAGSEVELWDSSTGKQYGTLRDAGSVTWVSFSPSGDKILSFDGSYFFVWDTISAKLLAKLPCKFDGGFSDASFSPDGSSIILCDKDGYDGSVNGVTIWDSSTGRMRATLAKNGTTAAFSPDGSRIVTAHGDAIKVWDSYVPPSLSSAVSKNAANALPAEALSDSINLAELLRQVLLGLVGYNVVCLTNPSLDKSATFTPVHLRQDLLAALAKPDLTETERVGLKLKLMAKVKQWRTAKWFWNKTLQAAPSIREDLTLRRQYVALMVDSSPFMFEKLAAYGWVEEAEEVAREVVANLDSPGVLDSAVSESLNDWLTMLASNAEFSSETLGDLLTEVGKVSETLWLEDLSTKLLQQSKNGFSGHIGRWSDAAPTSVALLRSHYASLTPWDDKWRQTTERLLDHVGATVDDYVTIFKQCPEVGEVAFLESKVIPQGDKRFSGSPHWNEQVADSMRRWYQWQRAVDYYRKANTIAGWRSVARLLSDEAALEGWGKVVEYKDATHNDLIAAGDAAARLKKGALARSMYQRALKAYPNKVGWINYNFAGALMEIGANEEALATYQLAIKEPTGLASANLALFASANLLGELNRADEGWATILKITSDRYVSLTDLVSAAYFAARYHPSEARGLLDRMEGVTAKPEDLEAACRWAGWALLNLGDAATAQIRFEQALEHCDSDMTDELKPSSDLFSGLAVALWSEGKKQEAIAAFVKTVEMGRASDEPVDWASQDTINALKWPRIETVAIKAVHAATLAAHPELRSQQSPR